MPCKTELKKKKKTHTFAVVLVVIADFLPVIDQRPFGVQISAGSVRQRLVVKVEQLAVVRRTDRRPLVDERPAQEFVFDLAGQPAR